MPLLSLIIWLPMVLIIAAALLVPRDKMKWAALFVMLLDLVLVLFAASRFAWDFPNATGMAYTVEIFGQSVQTHFQLREHMPWLEQFRVSYTVGVDQLSMMLIVLTAVIGVIAVLCSWTAVTTRETEFYLCLCVLQTGIMGTFLALDLFLFYVFWELMLLPLYFLIGIFGSKNRIYATMKFVLYTLVGSVLMLLGIIWIYFNGGNTYSYEALVDSSLPQFKGAMWPFLALFFAFAVKVPLLPFHTWLPDAHTEAPTAGSVILAAVLLKTGVYGMLRFCLPLFPDAAVAFAPTITYLSCIAIVYGAMTAMVQTDVKRLVAYSSVSHMGFIVLGVFAMNSQAMSGAIIQMFNHGISTGGLFLAVGMLYERRHTREMSEFGGLSKNMPIFAALTMVMVMSSAALPGLNGFIGEFNILMGSMNHLPMRIEAYEEASFLAALGQQTYTWFPAALAATGVIFGAVYLLIMYQRTFFGELDLKKNGTLADLYPREWGQLAFLSVVALVIGLYPKPVMEPVNRATAHVLKYVEPVLISEARERGAVMRLSDGTYLEAAAAPSAAPAARNTQQTALAATTPAGN